MRFGMPTVYAATCSACDYKSPIVSAGYAAVIVDEPKTSFRAHPDNPHLVILSHPCELQILESLGFSYASAALAGRLVIVHRVVCQACGTHYELRRLSAGWSVLGCSGCLALLGISAVVGLVIGVQLESIPLGCFTGFLSLGALERVWYWTTDRYVRRRYADRVREFDRGTGCPRCGSTDYVDFGSRARNLACPVCGGQTLRAQVVGKS